jgi:beta-mannosidase
VCEGLDTIASVYINGILVGKSDNMFRRYSWDVTSILEEGENNILVAFTSAKTYASKKAAEYPYPLPAAGTQNRFHQSYSIH